VIISIYVSMFTALINLVVDFLFVDILFAPTAKPTPSSPSAQADVPMATPLERVRRFTATTLPSATLDLETIRVVPGTTSKAHALARLSVDGIISERATSIRSMALARQNPRPLLSSLRIKRRDSLSTEELAIEMEFANLATEIAQQRKLLRRTQWEKYDEMWG
jgi:hypothetical protein